MDGSYEIPAGTIVANEFRIEKKLASGGMGDLYVATQLNTGILRALKTMRRDLLADPRLRARFTQEATIAASFKSEHVVKVIRSGTEGPGGLPFIVMELLEGQNLGDILRARGALPHTDVRTLFVQFGHAMREAHSRSIIHRDLKPDNLFVATSNRADVHFTLKVLDFGIAKIVHDALAITKQTQMLGTPSFMAPEQADPHGVLSPATDVWAIALIAFQVLTGRPYWLAENAEASLQALLNELLVRPLAPASERAFALGCQTGLPPGFDAWFAACVNRELATRLPNAQVAFERLLPLLQPTAGAPVGVAATAPDHQRREPRGAPPPPERPLSTPPPVVVPPRGTIRQTPMGDPSPPAQPPPTPGEAVFIPPPPPRRQSSTRRRIVVAAAASTLALAGGAGLYGWNAWLRTHVHDCVVVASELERPICIGPTDTPPIGRSSYWRETSRGGRVLTLERLNYLGKPIDASEGYATFEYTYTDGVLSRIDERDGSGLLRAHVERDDGGKRERFFDGQGRPVRLANGAMTIEREMNAAGLPLREQFRTASGALTPNGDGAFARLITNDARGCAMGTKLLGPDGRATPGNSGIAEQKIERDAACQLVSTFTFDETGTPTADGNGCFGSKYERDAHGEWVRYVCLDASGKPLRSFRAAATTERKLDAFGRETERTYLDADGGPMAQGGGVAKETTAYDGDGRVATKDYFGVNGEPILNDDGVHGYRLTYDTGGHVVSRQYVDLSGAPTWHKGYALVRATYDDHNDVLGRSYFDPDGHPVVTDEGFASEKIAYDEHDHEISRAYFGGDGKPIVTDKGYASIRYERDAWGDATAQSFFDETGATTLSQDWVAIWKSRFDERGWLISSASFGRNGAPTLSKNLVAVTTSEHDAWGRTVSEGYAGTDGGPVRRPPGMVFGRKFTFNARGRVTEARFLGPGGVPSVDRNGTAFIRQEFDVRGHPTKQSYFGADGAPWVQNDLFASQQWRYDEDGELLEKALFDAAGKPTLGTEWSSMRSTWDHGREMEQRYYGTDGKLFAGSSFAIARFTYDPRGRAVSTALFDANEKPYTVGSGPASVLSRDALGRVVETSLRGVTGDPQKGKDGWAFEMTQYDSRGRVLEVAWLDDKRASVLNTSQDAARVRYGYDDHGRTIETRYFGTDGAPRVTAGNGAIARITYNARGWKVRVDHLDASGALVKVANNSASHSYEYDDRGEVVRETFRGADGLLPQGALDDRFDYDARGRMTKHDQFDGNGKLSLNHSEGWATEKRHYDEYDRLVEQTYFDEKAHAVADSVGCATMRTNYRPNGVLQQQQCLGVAGNVVTTTKYDERGKVIP